MKKALGACLCAWVMLFSSSSWALNLNICKKLVEDIFIPPVYESSLKCSVPENTWKKIAFCGLLPQCCIPGCCLLDPACYTTMHTLKIAGYWKYSGELSCNLREIEFKDLLHEAMSGQIENLADLLTGDSAQAVIEAANFYIDSLLSSSREIPPNWRSLLKQYIEPVYDGGNTGYAIQDIDNVRITSSENTNYSFFLIEGMGAVTLGPVIIIKERAYQEILNYQGENLQELVQNATYNQSHALELIAHELVHVKQFRTLGRDTFIKNYYVPFIFSTQPFSRTEYFTNPFEQEAYGFTPKMAQRYGGNYCKNVKEFVNRNIQLSGVLESTPLVTCQ